MIYLFSKDGLRFLESICFSQTLFSFDFDGTLSKIVKNPDDAKINFSTLSLVQKLGERAPVAIISGRGLADLKNKFNPSPGYLVGNHGLEGIHSGKPKLGLFKKSCEKWKKDLFKSLSKKNELIDGIEIEDKTFSLAVHYRKSRSKKIAKAKILESAIELNPKPRIILGKSVVNVIPEGAPHKGVALLELMKKSNTKSSLYIGDDDTDEDVFALNDQRLFTIRVGKKTKSQAKFFIQNHSEINMLLKYILNFIKPQNMIKNGVRLEHQRIKKN
jgi:trehalose 6-phosphate phosphatase